VLDWTRREDDEHEKEDCVHRVDRGSCTLRTQWPVSTPGHCDMSSWTGHTARTTNRKKKTVSTGLTEEIIH